MHEGNYTCRLGKLEVKIEENFTISDIEIDDATDDIIIDLRDSSSSSSDDDDSIITDSASETEQYMLYMTLLRTQLVKQRQTYMMNKEMY